MNCRNMHSRHFFLTCVAVFGTFAGNNAACPNIISRSGWGGQQPKRFAYLVVPLPHVTIHHTATPDCKTLEACSDRVKNIQSHHMDQLGWHDIGFSYLIGGDGNVYEGVGWTKEGAHTYGWNKKSVGVVFIGDYQDTEPTSKMMDAARKLVDCGKTEGYLRGDVKVVGARQLVSTISPGNKLYERIKNWPEWASSP